jgi:hypothetical protein
LAVLEHEIGITILPAAGDPHRPWKFLASPENQIWNPMGAANLEVIFKNLKITKNPLI